MLATVSITTAITITKITTTPLSISPADVYEGVFVYNEDDKTIAGKYLTMYIPHSSYSAHE